MFYSWVGRISQMGLFSSWEGLSTKIHFSDNQTRIFFFNYLEKEGEKKSKEYFRTSSWQILIWLFLGKTVIPQENFHFKKKEFPLKNHSDEKRLATATKANTTGLSQGKVNAKARGLDLPQSSCRIVGTVHPFAMMFLLLQLFCLHRPSPLQGRNRLSLYVVHSLLQHVFLMAFSTTVATVSFPPTAATPQYQDEEKNVTYGCNTLLIKHHCTAWGCGGMPFHHRTNQSLYTQNQ